MYRSIGIELPNPTAGAASTPYIPERSNKKRGDRGPKGGRHAARQAYPRVSAMGHERAQWYQRRQSMSGDRVRSDARPAKSSFEAISTGRVEKVGSQVRDAQEKPPEKMAPNQAYNLHRRKQAAMFEARRVALARDEQRAVTDAAKCETRTLHQRTQPRSIVREELTRQQALDTGTYTLGLSSEVSQSPASVKWPKKQAVLVTGELHSSSAYTRYPRRGHT